MITFRQKGDFSNLSKQLSKAKSGGNFGDLDRVGREGVAALSSATPMDTGLTKMRWRYVIVKKPNRTIVEFHNDNVNEGVPVAIVLQYGHATKNGGWINGRDYINPSITPIFEQLVAEAWKGVR